MRLFGKPVLALFAFQLSAQHTNEITARLDGESKQIEIKQRFVYQNSTNSTLPALYFNDWNHAYANNTTPLSKRFGEDFNRSLHLAKPRKEVLLL